MQRRARAKLLSLPIAVRLAERRTLLEKSYRNTAYCGAVVEQRDGKLSQRWCGNRWCLACARVRTARAIHQYRPVIEKWESPHMVTLTIPNVSGDLLHGTLRAMAKAFESCRRAMKRTHEPTLVGVRKLECTYNRKQRTYHPHYHVVTATREQADKLLELWLVKHPEARAIAQDVRPCDAAGVNELFKYFTKLTTPATGNGGRQAAPTAALDVIFTAMRGLRVYQSLGFTLPKEDEERAIEDGPGTMSPANRGTEAVTWEWSQRFGDWIDYETGEVLADYEPSERFRNFVDGIAPPEVCDLGGGP